MRMMVIAGVLAAVSLPVAALDVPKDGYAMGGVCDG